MNEHLKKWAIDATERAVKTFAQGYLIAFGVSSSMGDAIVKGDMFFTKRNLMGGLVGAAFSGLTSLASRSVGDPDSASVVNTD